MAYTDVKIASMAMAKLGGGSISSFNDQTERSATIGTIYDGLREKIMTLPVPWHFAMTKRQLAQVNQTPAFEFEYMYQIPAEAIAGIWAMYNDSAQGLNPVKDFKVYGDKLECNYEYCYVDYKIMPDEGSWPVWFANFMVAALQAEACLYITDNATLERTLMEYAYGPPEMNGMGGLLGRIILVNQQMQGSMQELDFPLTDIRD